MLTTQTKFKLCTDLLEMDSIFYYFTPYKVYFIIQTVIARLNHYFFKFKNK